MLASIDAVGLELLPLVARHVLLLPHLLPPDTMSQVESSKAGNGYPLIRELTVEELGPPLEREASPLLKGRVARQEVNMMLLEFEHLSLTSCLSFGLQCMSTDMLNSVVWDTKGLGDVLIRDVLVGVDRGISASEPQ